MSINSNYKRLEHMNYGLFYYSCAGSLSLLGLFSSFGEQRLPSSCDMHTSHCSGLFCCGEPAPEHGLYSSGSSWAQQLWFQVQTADSIAVVHRLSCPVARGASLGQGRSPCLLHWQADSLPLSRQGSPEL